jgi:hypothetical protein
MRSEGIHMKMIYIASTAEDPALLKELAILIESESCHVMTEEELSSAGSGTMETGIAKCDVLVLVVGKQPLNMTAKRAIELAKFAGRKIVGVKAPGFETVEPPLELENYGHAWVNWQQVAIEESVCGGGTEWMDSSGASRAAPNLKRHKCKKPKGQRKSAA